MLCGFLRKLGSRREWNGGHRFVVHGFADFGAVAAKLVSPGEYVKDGTGLFRIVADNPIRFRASVPERYLSDVKASVIRASVVRIIDAIEAAFSSAPRVTLAGSITPPLTMSRNSSRRTS